MPKQIYPATIYSIYSDDAGSQIKPDFSHLEESFQIADLLKQLGHDDAAECIRPVHFIAGLRPAALMEKLSEFASIYDFACIVALNNRRSPEIIWHPYPNGVNRLVKLRLDGGHILGLIGLNSDGSFDTNTDPGPEQPIRVALLNLFARSYQQKPEVIAAEELLVLNDPKNFETSTVENTLDRYSEWSDKNPINILDEICTATAGGNDAR